jgi:hypothetical protein
MGFFYSIKKSARLRKISKILGGKITTEELLAFNRHSKKEEAFEQLYDLCQSDPPVSEVMKKYKADRNVLSDIYHKLLASGAGQWVSGHYVAVSALAYAFTLDYLLDKFTKKEFTSDTAFRIIEYFEKGEVGPVDGKIPSVSL